MLGLPTHSYGQVDDNYQEVIAMEMKVMMILVDIKITPVISKYLLKGLTILTLALYFHHHSQLQSCCKSIFQHAKPATLEPWDPTSI